MRRVAPINLGTHVGLAARTLRAEIRACAGYARFRA
jgi:hypothetical protein